ncbi:MAG: hypothetical protein ABI970_23965 [Chloroflexota bacterium]|nr:hypothetical protein [Anaerolineae bacterium]
MSDKMTLRKDVTITLATTIPSDRHLVIDLPADVPVGPAEIRISIPVSPTADEVSPVNPALEIARAKFRAVGSLSTTWKAPEDALILTDEELFKLTEQLAGGASVDEIMKDIRGDW